MENVYLTRSDIARIINKSFHFVDNVFKDALKENIEGFKIEHNRQLARLEDFEFYFNHDYKRKVDYKKVNKDDMLKKRLMEIEYKYISKGHELLQNLKENELKELAIAIKVPISLLNNIKKGVYRSTDIIDKSIKSFFINKNK